MFRTSLTLKSPSFAIKYKEGLMAMGSCFAQNIASRLEKLCYQLIQNPFGVMYNPLSLANGLSYLTNPTVVLANDLHYYNGLWHSWQHHGSFSGENRTQVLKNINSALETAKRHLKKTDYLLLTLGTAWVYEWLETGVVVANCHKYPKAHFSHRRLGVGEIVERLGEVFRSILSKRENLRIIITVSPIRHLKNGAIANQLSKSVLILAAHQLKASFEKVDYFPAYELMMDELRDYRFYAEDMIHPSKVAVDYIWEKFENHYLNQKESIVRKKIHKLNLAAQHKPFKISSSQHQHFLEKQLLKLGELKKQLPFLDFSKLQRRFEEQQLSH